MASKHVQANCFGASLLRTQLHMPFHAFEHTLSTKLNNDSQGQMATAMALAWI